MIGVLLVLIWLACGLVAGHIHESKGRSRATGFLAGFILGPLGIILAAIAKTRPRRQGDARLQGRRAPQVPAMR